MPITNYWPTERNQPSSNPSPHSSSPPASQGPSHRTLASARNHLQPRPHPQTSPFRPTAAQHPSPASFHRQANRACPLVPRPRDCCPGSHRPWLSPTLPDSLDRTGAWPVDRDWMRGALPRYPGEPPPSFSRRTPTEGKTPSETETNQTTRSHDSGAQGCNPWPLKNALFYINTPFCSGPWFPSGNQDKNATRRKPAPLSVAWHPCLRVATLPWMEEWEL